MNASSFAKAAEVVKYRYFLGLSVLDTAGALEVSERTARNDWTFAKVWLSKRLANP